MEGERESVCIATSFFFSLLLSNTAREGLQILPPPPSLLPMPQSKGIWTAQERKVILLSDFNATLPFLAPDCLSCNGLVHHCK